MCSGSRAFAPKTNALLSVYTRTPPHLTLQGFSFDCVAAPTQSRLADLRVRVRSGDLSVWGGTLLTGSAQMWMKGRLARVRERSQASCLPGAGAHVCLCFKSLSLIMPAHKLRRWRLMQGFICVCRLVCVGVCVCV